MSRKRRGRGSPEPAILNANCQRPLGRLGNGEGVEGLQQTDHQGQATLGEMHHSGVEIGALVECGRDHGGREGRGDLGKPCQLSARCGRSWG
jgi:hypothetical protein